MRDISVLDNIIVGRVDPHIYAFTTETVPNYLKVGDTFRPVSVRLSEWEEHFPDLKKQYEGKAKVDEDVFFRDFAVHYYLENDKKRIRLQQTDIPKGIYYSREFFREATDNDIIEAIEDISTDYQEKGGKYQFFNADTRLAETYTYERTENYEPRSIQSKVIEKFKSAVDAGRTNLLMYAVMRFGKSFTSMCCAADMGADIVVIVSAKADVKEEWKKTVESHIKFADYVFVDSKALLANENIIKETREGGKKLSIFLTLQDLQGDKIKEKHREVFENEIDLLIIDETHFGARAEKYGQVLRDLGNGAAKATTGKKDADDFVEASVASEQIEKALNPKIRLHLSGTPYRILMRSEFTENDIIAFCQFSDIVHEQEAWDKKHILSDDVKEWDNPYYGFPQMIRFAFNPNESSRQRLNELKQSGVSFAFSALLKPKSLKKSEDGSHRKFVFEQEVLDLLEVIDGSKEDDELLGFLDYDKIKNGKMCRHIVIVLPYCASCDAMEALINNNPDKFKNLNHYEIINISGLDVPRELDNPRKIKELIHRCEKEGKKTLTLTVNRMLTGSTVEEWDTMLFLKDTSSPQEYDQAIFRLQNQYIKSYADDSGNVIKYNMKPQTLLVDFMPERMFSMQEQKAQFYNVNADKVGNSRLEERLREELRISPIIIMNKDKMEQVQAVDIMNAVSEYSKSRGVAEETLEIPVDLSLMEIEVIREAIERENEIGSKAGFTTKATKGGTVELDTGSAGGDNGMTDEEEAQETAAETGDKDIAGKTDDDKKKNDPVKQFRSYYARILFFAFLTRDSVISLEDIISKIENEDNARIAKNIGISKPVLENINCNINKFILRDLDYKINNLSRLSNDTTVAPLERAAVAVHKFGKLGESEVVTPKNICDDMLALVPNDGFIGAIENNHKILDIAGKAGEFALAIYERFVKLGYGRNQIKDAIYTIPTSGLTYEFTRMIYEILGLNVANIAGKFNDYDLLKVKNKRGKIDYEKICAILSQNKPFNEITIYDEILGGDEKVNFDVVVGNPPYQENVSSGKDNDSLGKQLFPTFTEMAHNVSLIYCSLITPSRWFTGDAQDKSFVKLRQFLKQNNDIHTMYIYPTTNDVFGGVVIKGGVNHFLVDKKEQSNVEFHTIVNGIDSTENRKLFEDGFDIVFRSSKDYGIVKKVVSNNSKSLFTITTGRNAFGIIGKPDSLKKQTTDLRTPNSVIVHCKNGGIRYIPKKNVKKSESIMNHYKAFISKSAGDPYSDNKVIGVPFFGDINTVCTDTFFPIGCFEKKEEAENLCKYIKTSFVRYLVNILKSSQNVTQIVYRFVPMQNFTNSSDVDWSKTIPEIDRQLYEKYGLTGEEIEFIESTIKPME